MIIRAKVVLSADNIDDNNNAKKLAGYNIERERKGRG